MPNVILHPEGQRVRDNGAWPLTNSADAAEALDKRAGDDDTKYVTAKADNGLWSSDGVLQVYIDDDPSNLPSWSGEYDQGTIGLFKITVRYNTVGGGAQTAIIFEVQLPSEGLTIATVTPTLDECGNGSDWRERIFYINFARPTYVQATSSTLRLQMSIIAGGTDVKLSKVKVDLGEDWTGRTLQTTTLTEVPPDNHAEIPDGVDWIRVDATGSTSESEDGSHGEAAGRGAAAFARSWLDRANYFELGSLQVDAVAQATTGSSDGAATSVSGDAVLAVGNQGMTGGQAGECIGHLKYSGGDGASPDGGGGGGGGAGNRWGDGSNGTSSVGGKAGGRGYDGTTEGGGDTLPGDGGGNNGSAVAAGGGAKGAENSDPPNPGTRGEVVLAWYAPPVGLVGSMMQNLMQQGVI